MVVANMTKNKFSEWRSQECKSLVDSVVACFAYLEDPNSIILKKSHRLLIEFSDFPCFPYFPTLDHWLFGVCAGIMLARLLLSWTRLSIRGLIESSSRQADFVAPLCKIHPPRKAFPEGDYLSWKTLADLGGVRST